MIANRYIMLFFILSFACSTPVESKNIFPPSDFLEENTIEKGNYIVIGAFKYEKNAKLHVLTALRKGFHGRYFLNETRGLFYVYIHKFKRKKRAFRITRRIQSYKLFDDVWVFSVGIIGKEHKLLAEPEVKPIDIDELEDNQDEISPKQKKTKRDTKKKHKNNKIDKSQKKTKRGKNKKDKKRKNKQLDKSNKKVELTEINDVEDTPTSNDVASTEELKEAKIGDFVVFDMLLFHKSSAILKSKARRDLTALSNFLKSNTSVEITIHGHTNGKFKGDIFLLKEGSDKYYTLNRKNIIVKGNEKRLSEERALLLKRFLVDSGISESRIGVKGWGAKKMLYHKEHFKSAQNRRVEIEIMEK